MATLCYEKVWTDKSKYDEAERIYYEKLAKAALTPLAGEVAKARQRLLEFRNNFQGCSDQISLSVQEASKCVANANVLTSEKEQHFIDLISNLEEQLKQITLRVTNLESIIAQKECAIFSKLSPPVKQEVKKDSDADDFDLFENDSEEEDKTAAKIREERLAAYNAKKSKKPALIAKSNIILDVKPWDDETDMKEMEAAVRKIEMDGLLWGAAKLVPLAYGIHKLQISCVVEDEKVSVDSLQEQIEAIEDYVQSVDIAAFNKV